MDTTSILSTLFTEVESNIIILSVGVGSGTITSNLDIMNIYAFLKLPRDDFMKIMKFKRRNWSKYRKYKEKSHDKPNKLYDKMIECEEVSDAPPSEKVNFLRDLYRDLINTLETRVESNSDDE